MPKLSVICGPMFSGKSGELIRQIKRAGFAGKTACVLKPGTDTRAENIMAREIFEGKPVVVEQLHANVITCPADAAPFFYDKSINLLAIDEAQFCDEWLLDYVNEVLLLRRHDSNFEIIVSGLDMDFSGKPFGPMPQLMAMADHVLKLAGVCMKCHSSEGTMTQRLVHSKEQVVVGDIGDYEVRCRKCHYIP